MAPAKFKVRERLPLRARAASFPFSVIVILLGVFALAGVARAQKPASLRPQGYVNDFANVINPTTRQELTAICSEVDQKAQAQIAVVTVKSLEGDSIDDYSISLAMHWGIGPKQKDRGVMILLAPREHKYRIEVGYGLEPILPDGLVGDFGGQALPQLRIGNFSGALLMMTSDVAKVIAKDRGVTLASLSGEEPSPLGEDTAPPPPSLINIVFRLLPILFLLIFPLLRFLFLSRSGSRYGRRHGVWWWGGPWYWGGGGFGGSWGGGSFGGGGGGFGGFGGGSFGGGGASGSW